VQDVVTANGKVFSGVFNIPLATTRGVILPWGFNKPRDCSRSRSMGDRKPTYTAEERGALDAEDVLGAVRARGRRIIYFRCSTKNKSDRLRVYPKT
jgi:hypothetical protein